MKDVLLLVLVITLGPAAAAQTGPPPFKPSTNPVSDSVRQVLTRESKNLVAAADLMPADKYTFRPTPAQMTFGQLAVHIVQTNVAICSAIAGTPPANIQDVMKLNETQPKDALVAALRQSFEYCSQTLAAVNDARLGEEVSLMGRGTGQSRAGAMITIATDWTDHYSTAAGYLRLNGILPPSASRQ